MDAGPRIKALKRLLRYALLSVVLHPLRMWPLRSGLRAGELYGELAWMLAPGLRRRTLRNLAAAFPDWPEPRRVRTARAVFRWVGRTGCEFLHLGGPDQAGLLARIRVEGGDFWTEAVSAGRGVVLVTGHLGNWELLGAWVATLGQPFAVLYHPFEEERLDRLVRSRRERAGVSGIPAERAARPVLRILRRGGVIGILTDRVPRGPAVACRFFGMECRTTAGPAWFAVRSGAALLPVSLIREPGGGFRLRFERPLRPQRLRPEEIRHGEREREEAVVAALTRRLTWILEEQIREAPEQWPWFHHRWKIRPGAPLGGSLVDPDAGPGGPPVDGRLLPGDDPSAGPDKGARPAADHARR